MDVNLMYSPLETVFQETLKREGRTVTAYTSGKQFRAFMRRNDDGNSFEDRITLFYPITAPVAQGSLISYGDKIYILVNRETEENYCYYKSSALACNGVITLNNGTIVGIPCYASSMKDGLAEQSDAISMIHGNMEFITEYNPLSEKLKIDNTFNEYGRTWKIDNTYYKDGILHLIKKVFPDEEPYEKTRIFIESLNPSYEVGDTAKLEATLYINDVITTGTVTWESSDNTVATIDEKGHVSFLKDGCVTLTAYWLQKNTYQSTEVIVGRDMPVTGYQITIDGRNELTIGHSRTYIARLYDSDGTEIEGAWNFEINSKYPKLIKTIVDGNKIKIDAKNDKNLIGEKLMLTAMESKTGSINAKSIRMTEAF